MKTYFDLLATLPQDALRHAVNLHIAANRAKTPEAHDAADDAVNALKLNESQAHVFFDYMQIPWDNADGYFNAMRSKPINFDIGDDLPGFYWCPDSQAVFSIDDIG